jgi:hypothetical protein
LQDVQDGTLHNAIVQRSHDYRSLADLPGSFARCGTIGLLEYVTLPKPPLKLIEVLQQILSEDPRLFFRGLDLRGFRVAANSVPRSEQYALGANSTTR